MQLTKMKNVSSLQTNNTNSPKTPGGISKSLLTPCRRLGLSRNWRKSGPSPFVSPLSSTSSDGGEQKLETRTRKRKQFLSKENTEDCELNIPNTETILNLSNDVEVLHASMIENEVSVNTQEDVPLSEGAIDNEKKSANTTPSRNIAMPRRKKSKTLLSVINKSQVDNKLDLDINNDFGACPLPGKNVEVLQNEQSKITLPDNAKSQDSIITNTMEKCFKKVILDETQHAVSNLIDNNQIVSKPVKSNSKNKKISKTKSNFQNNKLDSTSEAVETKDNPLIQNKTNINIIKVNNVSPNELKKECIVVIQRKLFNNIDSSQTKTNNNPEIINTDEDEPLITLQKQKFTISELKDHDDFIENKVDKSMKLKSSKSPKIKVKTSKLPKNKEVKTSTKEIMTSQEIDNEDDDFDNKKTILIRKSYDKVSKPIKAKSTGSITQKDIDNLRKRIEAKKKLLLAQSLTETGELRDLIKKWQKGCQDALMELLELMKNKFPDKANMDYSEILRTLKIPPALVGYDSDNDCFHSPDDASIILGQFKDY